MYFRAQNPQIWNYSGWQLALNDCSLDVAEIKCCMTCNSILHCLCNLSINFSINSAQNWINKPCGQLMKLISVYEFEAGYTITMKCPLCDMRFCSKRKSQYYRHYKTVHLKLKEFTCDFCSKKFSRGEHKKRHILRNCKLAKQFMDGLELTQSTDESSTMNL